MTPWPGRRPGRRGRCLAAATRSASEVAAVNKQAGVPATDTAEAIDLLAAT
jgi:hypothetical protein